MFDYQPWLVNICNWWLESAHYLGMEEFSVAMFFLPECHKLNRDPWKIVKLNDHLQDVSRVLIDCDLAYTYRIWTIEHSIFLKIDHEYEHSWHPLTTYILGVRRHLLPLLGLQGVFMDTHWINLGCGGSSPVSFSSTMIISIIIA